jgi:aminopeptidase N
VSARHLVLIAGLVACGGDPPETPPDPGRWRGYPECDVLAYEIELVLDPRRAEVAGQVTYRLRAVEELAAVRLDAATSPGWTPRFFQGRELAVRRAEGHLEVALEERVSAGAELSLRAELSGQPPDGLYFGRTRAGRPVAFTDHYAVRARGWLPCEDHPGDRALFRLRLAVPEEDQVVCTGAMQRVASAPWIPPGHTGWSAESALELPTYLVAFCVGPYARVEEGGDPRLVPHYVYAEDVEAARAALRFHGEWLREMERRIGPYPFEKYCVVQVPTRWGGMENAGNTWVREDLFDGPGGGSRATGTLAHELAHQWFGDGVGCAEWSETWLSEGFASYFGPLLEACTGGRPELETLAEQRARWLEAPEGKERPVRWTGYDDPNTALSANVYSKGAWVLHMLEVELGDEAFFAGLRRYYREQVGRAATSDDLRAALEAESGRELAGFFRQWLDRPGCPELAFTWSAGGVVVEQLQGEPFEFPLRLAWRDAAGARREDVFRIRAARTELALEGAPISPGEVDPRVELLYRPR